MKISEITDYLKDYPRTNVTAAALGCAEFIIRTDTEDTDAELLVQEHFEQIKEAIESMSGHVIFVRILPCIVKQLDDEGDLYGYRIRTRLQIGPKGKCITQEQYDHLEHFRTAVMK